jgi:hypothetical protein
VRPRLKKHIMADRDVELYGEETDVDRTRCEIKVGEAVLKRITADRLPDGRWKLVRERAETGETFECDDLHDVLDTVLAAYYPDGTPRPYPRTSERQSGGEK